MSHKVFVYGTLKRNEPNHHWLTDPSHGYSKFIGNGTTKTKYPLVIATKYNIPFLLYAPGSGYNVVGEVYEIDELMLSKLDILEGYPEYYIRELDDIEVKAECGTEISKCWVYFLKNFKKSLLTKPMMSNYSSYGPHKQRYVESENSTIDDVLDKDPRNNYCVLLP